MQDQGTGSTLKRGSNSAAYLQARLRRDAPEVADALEVPERMKVDLRTEALPPIANL